MGISIMIGNRIATGKKSGAGYSGPAPLIHYDFSRYSNEDFLNNPDLLVKDLTGNGHDLKLYNFAFAGMSGFGGYTFNFNDWNIVSGGLYDSNIITKNASKLYFAGIISDETKTHAGIRLSNVSSRNTYQGQLKITGLKFGQRIVIGDYTSSSPSIVLATSDGILSYNFTTSTGGSGNINIYLEVENNTRNVNVVVEQLPIYPGGLVSDGVDDYGLCVKDFTIPDDYTVCIVRKYIDSPIPNTSLVGKSRADDQGAFIFEYNRANTYSYGISSKVTFTDLFTYQSKNSYNGNGINVGSATDTENDKLTLFASRADAVYSKAALYDLRIYDHSLTDEELQLVKDDMMRNYEKNAKPLEGITYVADWDAKGRSNDEDADVRDKWIDKATGKTIDLNNFAYAGMSGWNGYAIDFNTLNPHGNGGTVSLSGDKVTITSTIGNIEYSIVYTDDSVQPFRIKVGGITDGDIIIQSRNSDIFSLSITEDGEYEIPASETGIQIRSNTPRESCNITIEQLPLYPGALVGDGVDDYGVTQEAINEEVGTVLADVVFLNESKNNYVFDINGDNRIYLYFYRNGNTVNITPPPKSLGAPNSVKPLVSTIRITNPNAILNLLSRYQITEFGNLAFYRLILIKEQLDDAQVEFLRWKVEKEYQEWCKKNGYNYALNQLTE